MSKNNLVNCVLKLSERKMVNIINKNISVHIQIEIQIDSNKQAFCF